MRAFLLRAIVRIDMAFGYDGTVADGAVPRAERKVSLADVCQAGRRTDRPALPTPAHRVSRPFARSILPFANYVTSVITITHKTHRNV